MRSGKSGSVNHIHHIIAVVVIIQFIVLGRFLTQGKNTGEVQKPVMKTECGKN